MGRLNGTVDLRLSVDDVNSINELIERDTAKPMVESQLKDGTIIEHCPACGAVLGPIHVEEKWPFCYRCGQRIDFDNIAL